LAVCSPILYGNFTSITKDSTSFKGRTKRLCVTLPCKAHGRIYIAIPRELKSSGISRFVIRPVISKFQRTKVPSSSGSSNSSWIAWPWKRRQYDPSKAGNYSLNDAVSHFSWTALPWRWRHYFLQNTGNYTPRHIVTYHKTWILSRTQNFASQTTCIFTQLCSVLFKLLHFCETDNYDGAITDQLCLWKTCGN
jgi:hypothetical protein